MEVRARAVTVLFGLMLLLGLTFVGTSANILGEASPSGSDLVNAVGLDQTATPNSRWPSWCA